MIAPRGKKWCKRKDLSAAPGTLFVVCRDQYFPREPGVRHPPHERQTRIMLADFRDYLGHEPTAADLTDSNVQGMVDALLAKGLNLCTASGRRRKLVALWTWMTTEGMVTTVPTVPRIEAPPRADIWKPAREPMPSNGPMLLSDYAPRYVAMQDGSEGYLKQFLWTIAALEKFAGKQLHFEDVNADLLNGYLMATKDSLAPVTRRSRRNMIRRLVLTAHDDDSLHFHLPRALRLATVRQRGTMPEAWSVDQVRRLLDAASNLEGRYRVSKHGRVLDRLGPVKRDYWRAYILAAWDSGWRGCDLRRLNTSKLNERGMIGIVQQKTGKPHVSRLRPAAIEALKKLGGSEPLKEWCEIVVWRRLAQRLVKSSGLEGTIGMLRHSSGTATEIAHPQKGYQFLGNTPDVFFKHYFDRTHLTDLPQPPELEPKGAERLAIVG